MPKPDVLAHARRFLWGLDPDSRLLETTRLFMETSPKISDWKSNELRYWCLEQIKAVSGTTPLKDGLRNPDVRTLLAVGYMAFVRAPVFPPPKRLSMPTPPVLKNLENDFFPVLLHEIKTTAKLLPSFKDRLEQAERRITQLFRGLEDLKDSGTAESLPGSTAKAPNVQSAVSNTGDGGWLAVGLVAVVFAVADVVSKLKSKN